MASRRYIIEVRDLTYYYPGSKTPALENVNMRVSEGEFVIIAGPSGGGKSTLCRLLLGLIPRYYGGRIEGEVIVDGVNVIESPQNMIGRASIVFQNPANQIANLVVEEEVAFGPENLLMPPNEIRRRVSWALKALGIEHLRHRLTYTLSGGELKKLAIASALAMKPGILILDEPLAHLDPRGSIELLELLYRLWREGRITIVMAEHRLSRAIKYAERIIVIDRTIVAEGDPRELVSKGILDEHGVETPPVAKLTKIRFASKAPLTVEEAAKIYGDILKRLTQKHKTRSSRRACGEAIIIDDLWYAYSNEHYVLKGVSLRIGRGLVTAIIGSNGAGKTTLIKHFNGLLKPSRGRVIILGMDTRRYSVAELSRVVGIVFQDPLQQFFNPTVEDEVAFAAKNMGLPDIQNRINRVLKLMGIYDLKDKSPYELSAGEQRKVAIASILVYEPEIIVLDEPTAGLDYKSKLDILEIINMLKSMGKTIIIVSHDIEFLAKTPLDHVIVMDSGRIVDEGDPRDILYNRTILERAGLIQPQIPELITYIGVHDKAKPLNEDELLRMAGCRTC